MNVGSLFSGIGGLDLGLERAGKAEAEIQRLGMEMYETCVRKEDAQADVIREREFWQAKVAELEAVARLAAGGKYEVVEAARKALKGSL